MDLKKIERLYGILVVTGMVLVLAGALLFDSLALVIVGIIPGCIAVLFVQPRAKCPHCGKTIRLKFSLPDKCPRCGTPLR